MLLKSSKHHERVGTGAARLVKPVDQGRNERINKNIV